MSDTRCEQLVRVQPAQECCSQAWEAAYRQFETPEQEVRKFTKRLRLLGADKWPRDARILELFCGRGNGLHALTRLGFQDVSGADLSASLLAQYTGTARRYVCDCRHLPFGDETLDIAIVHGGLHHLPQLPSDLERTLAETHRVLCAEGRLVMVEPWLTPFLRLVHACGRVRWLRRLSPKLQAFWTMTINEWDTYFAWLRQEQEILDVVSKYFHSEFSAARWGKLRLVGRKRSGAYSAVSPEARR